MNHVLFNKIDLPKKEFIYKTQIKSIQLYKIAGFGGIFIWFETHKKTYSANSNYYFFSKMSQKHIF